MKNKRFSTMSQRSFAAMLLSIMFICSSLYSQPLPGDKPPVASGTEQADPISATSKANAPKDGAQNNDYTQNPDSMSLEEKIAIFNKEFCPPETQITEISEFNLLKLARAELIKRAEIEKFKDMMIVDGKVYVKNEKPAEKPDNKPKGEAGKNLLGDFTTSCEELKEKNTRGQTDGNKRPEKVLELKRRKITYRDGDNQLKEMEVYSPPKFPAKKKDIAGTKGKKVKDYATSILVPKNVDPKDAAAFDDMPSADAWLDDQDAQKQ